MSDFNALKEEYKNEMVRFNNVKKYVSMLTDQIVKYKQIIGKLLQIAPKKKASSIVNLSELNLDPDDPLLKAADQLSEPRTPKISERFKVKENIVVEARQPRKEKSPKHRTNEEVKQKEYEERQDHKPVPVHHKGTKEIKLKQKVEQSEESGEGTNKYQRDIDISTNHITLTEANTSSQKVLHGQAVQRITTKEVRGYYYNKYRIRSQLWLSKVSNHM